MPGLKQTGRMRKAIMKQMGLIKTKRNGHWKLIPVPIRKNSDPKAQSQYTPEMIEAQEKTGYTPEQLALWEPTAEVGKMLGYFLFTSATLDEWRKHLRLEWTVDQLPKCKGCEFETVMCQARPPIFQCRVLLMASKSSLRPNQYWSRQVELG